MRWRQPSRVPSSPSPPRSALPALVTTTLRCVTSSSIWPPSRKPQVNGFMNPPLEWGRMPSRARVVNRPLRKSGAPTPSRSRFGKQPLPTCPPFLLPGRHALTVGAVLLTMEIAGVRRRMEREVIERRNIVFVHAVAERRSVRESRNQNPGYCTESDVYYVVVRPASAKGPAGIVAAQWAEAILLRERCWRDGKVDAGDVGYKNTQQVFTRGRRNRKSENAI